MTKYMQRVQRTAPGQPYANINVSGFADVHVYTDAKECANPIETVRNKESG